MREDAVPGHRLRGGDGHVLEFPGHNVALRGEGGERCRVVPAIGKDIVAHLRRHRVAFGRVGDAAIA